MMHVAECPDLHFRARTAREQAPRRGRIVQHQERAASPRPRFLSAPAAFHFHASRFRSEALGRLPEPVVREEGMRARGFAVAAALSVLLGRRGLRALVPAVPVARPETRQAAVSRFSIAAAAENDMDESVLHDAWQSEELSDFHDVVKWETWIDESSAKGNKARIMKLGSSSHFLRSHRSRWRDRERRTPPGNGGEKQRLADRLGSRTNSRPSSIRFF